MRIHSALDTRRSALRRDAGFTLIELLVVIGIIALLAAILFPVISKVRESAREADTKALIGSIEAACQTYHQDYTAYPGPLSNAYVQAIDQGAVGPMPLNWRTNGDSSIGAVAIGSTPAQGSINVARIENDGVVAVDPDQYRVTAAENLVLGLLGGVAVNKTRGVGQYFLEFDPATVGQGASSLNPVRAGRAGTYMQLASLSKGKFIDDNGLNMISSRDSIIPEFVDRFSQPMPILVLRARIGGRAASSTPQTSYADDDNNVVVNVPAGANGWENGQYCLADITPYTQSQIGMPLNLKQSAYVPTYDATKPHGLAGVDVTKGMNKAAAGEFVYPYDGFSYLADPSSYTMTDAVATKKRTMKARKQDTIILISAGRDRVYGTDDDVTNFGSVRP